MKYFLIFFAFFVVSCDQVGEGGLTKDFDRSGRPQKITVFVYIDDRAMRKAHSVATKERPNDDLLGWSRWSEIETDGCEIHVVKLKHANHTAQQKTWGHELAHCLYGAFHKEL